MYEYEKKMEAARLIADTLNPMSIRDLIGDLEAIAESKERQAEEYFED